MKKILAVLLSVIFAFSALAVCASAEGEEEAAFKNGDIITLGSYPQSKVTDAEIISSLNEIANATDHNNWNSYGYYFGNITNDLQDHSWADGKMINSSYYTDNMDGEAGVHTSLIDDDNDCKWDGKVMRYLDVELNGVKYRGVRYGLTVNEDATTKFVEAYRPKNTGLDTKAGNTLIDTAAYKACTGVIIGEAAAVTLNTYWFKYDDLKWEIVDADKGLAVCTTIIDSQPYNEICFQGPSYEKDAKWIESKSDYEYLYYNDSPYQLEVSTIQSVLDFILPFFGTKTPSNMKDGYKKNLCSDYSKSSVRSWLNGSFYNTAFSGDLAYNVAATNINNNGFYTLTGDTEHKYLDSDSTRDRVFLLAANEIGNVAGTESASEYAYAQGLNKADYSYLLRTPGILSCLTVTADGEKISTSGRVNDTFTGIRPAIVLGEDEPDNGFFKKIGNAIKDFFVNIFSKIAAWFEYWFPTK